jgi:hypothetical protein
MADEYGDVPLHEVPTGQTALKYNVVIKDLKAKFMEVVDYDQPYRMEVELTLSIRSVNTD